MRLSVSGGAWRDDEVAERERKEPRGRKDERRIFGVDVSYGSEVIKSVGELQRRYLLDLYSDLVLRVSAEEARTSCALAYCSQMLPYTLMYCEAGY